MKILVLPKPIEGVAREELLQHAAEEIQAVWELYAQGICREFYTRANEPGRVVLMFESASVEAANTGSSVPTATLVAPAESECASPQGASRTSFPSVRAGSFPPTR